jgi:hypothetical protein
MAEAGVRIDFEMYPMVNAVKSKEAGREVCDDIPHVRIRNAGEDKHEFFGPVNEQIMARFPEEWEAFQRGSRVAESGTPVDRWPQLTPAQVRTFKGLNFYTVEDVASASDAAIQRYGMGGQKLRTDAQKFLSLAQAAADVAQLDDLKEAVAAKDGEIASMREQMNAMQKMMEKLSAPEESPKKRKATAE